MQSENKSFQRTSNENFLEKDNTSTPEVKLSTQFSSGREGRGNSDQTNYKPYKRRIDRTENEANETFITTTDYQHQMSAMDDRISKLENLVWSLYKELNGKIESSTATTQAQISEVNSVTQQVFNQLGDEIGSLKDDFARVTVPLSRSQDEGYDGSEEGMEEEGMDEHPIDSEEHKYIQGSLDEVVEEGSQYYSNEEKAEFEQNSVDRTDQLSSTDRYKYENLKEQVEPNEYDEEEEQPQPHLIDQKYYEKHDPNQDKFMSNSEEGKGSSLPVEGTDAEAEAEGEGEELEYYFSCHERMIKDNQYSTSSDVFRYINKDELRENITMPDLSRSTLVDQIDYELDNFKINESSVFESSTENDYNSNRHPD